MQPLTWSILSERTSLEVRYCVYCTAAYVAPDHIVWMKTGTNVMYNTSTTTLSNHLVNPAIDNYTNILTVTGDHHTQNISCAADYGVGTNAFQQLTIEGSLLTSIYCV